MVILIVSTFSLPSQLHRCISHFVETLNIKVNNYAENNLCVSDCHCVFISIVPEKLNKIVSVVGGVVEVTCERL